MNLERDCITIINVLFSCDISKKNQTSKPDDLRRHPDESQTESAALKIILYHCRDPIKL